MRNICYITDMRNISKLDQVFPIPVCLFISKQSFAMQLLDTTKYVAMVASLLLLLVTSSLRVTTTWQGMFHTIFQKSLTVLVNGVCVAMNPIRWE